MTSRPLRQDEKAEDDKRGDHCRSERPAEVETAGADWFIQKVAESSAKRPGEDKGSPEEQNARDISPEVKSGDNRQSCRKDQRASFIPETGVSHPVTEGSTERLRKGDGSPIEAFQFRRRHGVHRNRPFRPIQQSEHKQPR